jgi:hypothetical protein
VLAAKKKEAIDGAMSFLQYATLSGNSSLIFDCLTFVVTIRAL